LAVLTRSLHAWHKLKLALLAVVVFIK
jgi:hypothetical protein